MLVSALDVLVQWKKKKKKNLKNSQKILKMM
jgi:hypothetical protein